MADVDNTAMADAPASNKPTEQLAAPAAVEALKTESAAVSTASTPIPTIEEQALSLRVSLADLCAKGTAAYSHKEYEKATDFFARAAEMQAEMNGEMDPENAEILFLYGRSLFKVGQSKSDVLGGKAPVTEKPKPEKKEKKAPKAAPAESSKRPEADSEADKDAEKALETKKPLFQFSGDENLVDDSDEDEEGGDEEAEEEEEDDLGVAFEILDLSRVLFVKRLEKAQEAPESAESEKGKEAETGEMSPEVRHIKERLADTHDLLTEISWENERHAQALNDARLSLNYKKELYSDDDEIVAEAHYKVSLALEFASVTQTEEDAKQSDGVQEVDQAMRDEAAKELEEAIRCTKLNLDNKEVELATTHAPEENDVTRQRIAEVKELIADMEERLKDLKKPPIDLNAAIGAGIGAAGGLMGALVGESKAEAEKRIEEAKKTATDLSGLVRKKAKGEPDAAQEKNGSAKIENAPANGKRKMDETPEPDSKKARVEDAVES